ncbi:MAG: hypothetical protein IKA04_07175 [Alistipes sp.]|nr:hypothetical protein [Alistipes sp.]
MKNRITTLGLMVAALFSACTADFENNEQINTKNYSTINLGIENTRVGAMEKDENTLTLYWQTGDQVAVNGVASQPIAEAYNGSTSAILSVEGDIAYPAQLLYPASVYESATTIKIPTEQAYLQDALANGYGIMLGYAEAEGATVAMKHTCGYIHLSLTGNTTIKKVALLANNYEYLSGEFATTYSAEGVSLAATTTTEAHTPHISITSAEGVALSSTATDLYFALPAGNYAKGFTIRVIDENEKVMIKKMYSAGKEIVAGVVIDMPTLEVNATVDNGINSVQDWVDMAHGVSPSAWANSESRVLVNTDLDMTGVTLPAMTLKDGKSVIDGRLHKIYNLTAVKEGTKSQALLFDFIANGCGVENLTLGNSAGALSDAGVFTTEPDSKLTVTFINGDGYAAPFVVALQGNLVNCINNAGLQINTANDVNTQIFAGGLTAGGGRAYRNNSFTGNITNSTNNGHICLAENVATNAIKNLQIGGVCGRAIDNTVSGCTNNGTIYVDGCSATTEFGSKDICCIAVGGVIGRVALLEGSTTSSATINNNTNTNNAGIYYKAHKALGDTPAVGGVVGVTAASISYCYNYGIVSAAYGETLSSALNNANTPIVGGVVGECDIDGITLSNLTNGDGTTDSGKVLLCSYNVTYAAYGGGIVGKGYSEGDDNATNNTVEKCTNSGKVAVTTKNTRVYLGGICGGGPNITNCTNNGEVTYWSANVQESAIGGIAGNLAGNLIGNYSFGRVYIKTQNRNEGRETRIGGLVGYCNVADLTFDNCAVSANIGTASGSVTTSNVGMICGLVNQAVNSGTIYVYGTRTWVGTGTALTAGNYMDYINGSDNDNLNALTVVFEDKKQ